MDSFIVREGPGRARGFYDHGNGKAKGHDKIAERWMEDGEYTIAINGVDVDSTAPVTTAPEELADGSTANVEVREGSVTVVEAPEGNDDSHALRLETDSNNGRLRFNTAFDEDQRVTLGELDELSINYYVESSDRTDVTPVIRLAIDADGDLSTTNDRGELVFEYAYQGQPGVTQDTWLTADLTTWNAWQRSNGQNRDVYPDIVQFSEWTDEDGYTPAGGINFNEDSVVLGYSIALGSGNGTGVMYVDEVNVGGVTQDFGLFL